MKKLWHLSLSAALGVAALVSTAAAAPLAVGTAQVPVSAEPDPVGLTIDSASTPFTVPGSFSGTLMSEVISGDASNPHGGLTFVYTLLNSAGPNSIGRFSIDGFLGFLTDVSYSDPGAGVAPAFADRNPFGDVVGFSFLSFPLDPKAGFLSPGSTSRRLVIQTDATHYHSVVGSLIDGGVTTVATFGPRVPEPASIVMAGLGGLALLGFARRRRVTA